MNPHLAALIKRCPELSPLEKDILAAYEMLHHCLLGGGKFLLCGNGGSAADCEHWAGELLKGFKSKRPLPEDDQKALGPEIGTKLQGGIPAIPLTGFPGLATAFTNDVDPLVRNAKPATVSFDILRNGQVRNVKIVQSSGIPTLDYSARRAVLEAAPLPELPREFERDSANVEFTFQLQR